MNDQSVEDISSRLESEIYQLRDRIWQDSNTLLSSLATEKKQGRGAKPLDNLATIELYGNLAQLKGCIDFYFTNFQPDLQMRKLRREVEGLYFSLTESLAGLIS